MELCLDEPIASARHLLARRFARSPGVSQNCNNPFMDRKLSVRYALGLMQLAKLDIAQHADSNGTLVAQLVGKLSLETVSGFLQQMRPLDADRLVLDMSGVSFLDSAGVGALVQLFVHRRSSSRKTAVAALTTQGAAVMQVAGLTKLIPTFATVAEASTAA